MEYEITEYQGKPARLYPDGSIRNERGQWLARHPDARVITSADAAELAHIRVERKRERARAGANAALLALKDKDGQPAWDNPQDLDYVEAISEAQARQALLVGDPGSTRAAEFVFTHTGVAEPRVEAQAQLPAMPADADIVAIVMRRRIASGDVPAEAREIVDALAHDAET